MKTINRQNKILSLVFPSDKQIRFRKFLPTHDACFVCGLNHEKGLRQRFFTDTQDRVHAHFSPDAQFLDERQMVHPGVVSALLQETMKWAVALRTDRMCVPGGCRIVHYEHVRVGTDYLATGLYTKDTGLFSEATAFLRDKRGVVATRMDGVFRLLSPRETADIALRLQYQIEDHSLFINQLRPE